MIVNRPCIACLTPVCVVVPDAGYAAWQAGAHVQDALPDLSPGEREFLISRTCERCFDQMFADCDE